MENRKLRIGDEILNYRLEKTLNKRLYIKIIPEVGVHVSAPASCNIAFIENMLTSKFEWIKKNISKVSMPKDKYKKRILTDGSIIKYLGEDITIQTSISKNIDASVVGNELRINCPEIALPHLDQILEQFYKFSANDYFINVYKDVLKLFPEVKIPPQMKIKNMKSRFGSYSKHTHSINMNASLMKFPLRIIEFIFAHELCHIKHMDHSAKFYAYFDSKMTDHRIRDKELKVLDKEYNLMEYVKI